MPQAPRVWKVAVRLVWHPRRLRNLKGSIQPDTRAYFAIAPTPQQVMVEPISIVSGVVAFGRLAGLLLNIYEQGFSRLDKAHEQYIDFGIAIRGLSTNLKNLEKIIRDAESESQLRSYQAAGSPDLQGLDDILGDYGKTLSTCEKIIKENGDLERDRAGFVLKVKWSTGLEAQVTRLTKRVAFHNIKMLLVLEPLRQKLFADIHARFDDVEDDLDYLISQQRRAADTHFQLEQRINLLLGVPEVKGDLPHLKAWAMFEVPLELADRFQSAVAKRKRFRGIDEQTSLRQWLDAFAIYFQEGRTSLDLEAYLRLMKSIWIIKQAQESAEYKRAAQNSLWRRYVKRLIKKLERECESQRDINSTFPDLGLIIHRPEDDFIITWDMGIDSNRSAMDEGPSLDELLSVPLFSEDDSVKQDLRVYRNINGTLLLRSSSTSTAPNDVYVLDRETDLFLDQAHLIPFYTAPGAGGQIYRLLIRNGRSGTGSEFRFVTPTHLFEFQKIVTDFSPVLHKDSIEVDCHIGKERLIRYGSVQLWQAVQPTKHKGVNDDDPGDPKQLMQAPSRLSKYSMFSRKSSDSSLLSRRSTLKEALSSNDFAFPKESTIVFFLRTDEQAHSDGQELSLLSVQLDKQTIINPRSCQCHREPDTCPFILLERHGGLVARRLDAKKGLEDLNLAAVGAHQLDKQPILRNLHWVRVRFPKVSDRKKFVETYEAVRKAYLKRLVAHDIFMKQVKSIEIYDKEHH